MKPVLTVILSAGYNFQVSAASEIGPEGYKLLWVLGILAVAGFASLFFIKWKGKPLKFRFSFPVRKKLVVEIRKDRLYYPRYLDLTIINAGKSDVDIDSPLLILSSIWITRKFKLKGTNKKDFYPLYLVKNHRHTLNIDLHRFYGFDRTLKRLPRARIVVTDTNGRRLGSKKILLRKTLFGI